MLTVSLTKEEVAILLQLMNSVSGLENVKALLPIYEKMKAATDGG